jgi:hypothetical protein
VRSPIAPDSAFPRGPNDDTLEGLFILFDFLLDNDVKTGMTSINDVRQRKRGKMIQLLKALRAWEEKRHAILQSIEKSSPSTSEVCNIRYTHSLMFDADFPHLRTTSTRLLSQTLSSGQTAIYQAHSR